MALSQKSKIFNIKAISGNRLVFSSCKIYLECYIWTVRGSLMYHFDVVYFFHIICRLFTHTVSSDLTSGERPVSVDTFIQSISRKRDKIGQ